MVLRLKFMEHITNNGFIALDLHGVKNMNTVSNLNQNLMLLCRGGFIGMGVRLIVRKVMLNILLTVRQGNLNQQR